MMRQSLHLDLIPMDLAWADPRANLKKMEDAIRERLGSASVLPAQSRIFIFPELTLTGFVTENSSSAMLDRESEEVRQVRELACRYKVGIVFGFPEKTSDSRKPVNTALFISPEGEEIADYQKIHLYTAGTSPESVNYERGHSGTLVSYRGWKIGFGICFDLRFPSLFQSYAREGVDLVILPACWIGGPGKSHQFRTLSAARAIENQCYFAVLNRSGDDPASHYEGESLCYTPKGEALTDSSGYDLDPGLLEASRQLQVRPSDLEEYPVLVRE